MAGFVIIICTGNRLTGDRLRGWRDKKRRRGWNGRSCSAGGKAGSQGNTGFPHCIAGSALRHQYRPSFRDCFSFAVGFPGRTGYVECMFFRAIGLIIGPTGKTGYLVGQVSNRVIRPIAGGVGKIEAFLVRPYGRLWAIPIRRVSST